MKRGLLVALLSAVMAVPAIASDAKIGFVNSERIMSDAAPAVKAKKKLEKEFEARDQELQRLRKQLQTLQESVEKNAMTLSEAQRRNKDKEYNDLNREFQRKQREFSEDLKARSNEELAVMLERANKAIRQLAEAEKYDIIFQEAVYASPRIDITDKVLKALAAEGK